MRPAILSTGPAACFLTAFWFPLVLFSSVFCLYYNEFTITKYLSTYLRNIFTIILYSASNSFHLFHFVLTIRERSGGSRSVFFFCFRKSWISSARHPLGHPRHNLRHRGGSYMGRPQPQQTAGSTAHLRRGVLCGMLTPSSKQVSEI